MKEFLSKKKATWVILILIALLPVPSVIKYMQRYVVRNGVVTAYRYEVLAPIDGVVDAISVSPGSVPGDTPALRLGNKRKMGQYKTHEKELAILQESLRHSRIRLADYLDKIQSDLDKSMAILQTRLVGERATRKETEHRRDRMKRLADALVATQEDAERAEAEFQEMAADEKSTRLEIEQLKHRQTMLKQGIFPSDVSDGLLQVQARINRLEQDILASKRRMGEAETDVTDEASQLDGKGIVNRGLASAAVKLPETAVVWEVHVQDGMEVAKGERLLSYFDRGQIMVVVAVDDATLELIQPNHGVRVRLFGREGFIEGKVSRVMGSAGIWHTNLFAAALRDRGARDGRVLVSIDDEKLHSEVEKFCGVGRTAYAEFEGIGLWEQYFGVFLR